ncbi:hypothetical protein YWY31_36310 [Paenibacillus illinoisensis]
METLPVPQAYTTLDADRRMIRGDPVAVKVKHRRYGEAVVQTQVVLDSGCDRNGNYINSLYRRTDYTQSSYFLFKNTNQACSI